MQKTNPSRYRPATWTTDEFIPAPEPQQTQQPPNENTPAPTPHHLAATILRAIRPFPDAYQAMLHALETIWPVPAALEAPSPA